MIETPATQIGIFDLLIALAIANLPNEGSKELVVAACEHLAHVQLEKLSEQEADKLFNNVMLNILFGGERNQLALITETGIYFARLLIKLQDLH